MAFFWIEDGIRIARELPPVRPASPAAAAHRNLANNAYQQQSKGGKSGERKPALLAKQIMKSPVSSLTADATFEEARRFIRQNRYRHVPIADAAGKILGIISDRDILKEAAEIGNTGKGWIAEVVRDEITVGEFMVKRVLTATPEAEIRMVAKALFEERIGSMPIVNEHGILVGIITRSDILRALISNAPLELWI